MLKAVVRSEAEKHPIFGCKIKKLCKRITFDYHKDVQGLCRKKGDCMANQTSRLALTKWVCKYPIVLTPSTDERQFMDSIERI